MGVRAVFLVGFMASGKTSVGQELARRLRWEFVDLDATIEAREQQSIPEIFRNKGEPGFRRVETAVLRGLTDSLNRDSVVALGGGAFIIEENRKMLRSWPSVFLEAPVEELWRRSSEDQEVRPLRRDREQFARLYAERLPFYRQATLVLATSGKPLPSICLEIESALQLVEAAETGRKTGTSPTRNSDSETGGLQ